MMGNAVAEVFALVPPENTRATRATIGKATICLHAFLMNAVGVLDNMAWAYLHWHGIESEVRRGDVDLFKEQLQKRLPAPFLAVLRSTEMVDWREDYLKPYRDALAHRIPPYIPESYLPEDQELLDATAAQLNLAIAASDWDEVDRLQERRDQILGHAYSFLHELTPPLRPLLLHPQLLSDSATIELIVREFLVSLPLSPPGAAGNKP
ncbi:hypothetical protein [Stenotrophomonas nematodicola]|uniref:hypothetical protein n=1 Tax=Stenotrophomonas nematodicola TaxID=2656746 RepID=UPI003D9AABFA